MIDKLDARPFRGELLQISAGPVRIAHSRLDNVLSLSGAAQPGMWSFGLPMPSATPALWCGKSVSAKTVSVFDLSGSFEALTQPGFESVVFSAEPEALESLGEDLGIGIPAELHRGIGVLPGREERMAVLRELLGRTLEHLRTGPDSSSEAPLQRTLEVEIPELLLASLADHRPMPRPVATHLKHRALRRALEYIGEHSQEPVGVREVCRATGASERTLRRAFTEELGVTPKAYLQGRRLNGLRRELRHSDSSATRVNEVANQWGFWHMGQLAADYRRWFGELPSMTLGRTGG